MVKLHDGVVGPQLLLDFLASGDLTLALQQQQQDLKRLFLQPNPLLAAAQFSSLQVEFKDAKADANRKRVFYGLGDVVPAGLTANGPAIYCKRPLLDTLP